MPLDKTLSKVGTSTISLAMKNWFLKEQQNSTSQPQRRKERFFPLDMNPVLSREKMLAPPKTHEGLPLLTLILQHQSGVNQQDFITCVYIICVYTSFRVAGIWLWIAPCQKAGWAVSLVFEYLMTYSMEGTQALHRVRFTRKIGVWKPPTC